MLELALIENLQREDLNPIEEAGAYERLHRDFGLTQDEISKRVGKSRASIANAMRLLDLEPDAQTLLKQGRISVGHAKVLLSLKSHEEQRLLMDVIVRQGASVRVAEKLAAQQLARPANLPPSAPRRRPNPTLSPAIQRVQNLLDAPPRNSRGHSPCAKSEEPFPSSTTEMMISIAFWANSVSIPRAAVKSYRKELWFDAPRRRALINITEDVEKCLAESEVREGLCLVNAMHITASVFINDDESGLHADFEKWLEQLAPEKPHGQYRHNKTGEDNADAHLKRTIMGREVVVAITKGKLDFGPWEQIFYGEFDGGRRKRVLVKIIGD